MLSVVVVRLNQIVRPLEAFAETSQSRLYGLYHAALLYSLSNCLDYPSVS